MGTYADKKNDGNGKKQALFRKKGDYFRTIELAITSFFPLYSSTKPETSTILPSSKKIGSLVKTMTSVVMVFSPSNVKNKMSLCEEILVIFPFIFTDSAVSSNDSETGRETLSA